MGVIDYLIQTGFEIKIFKSENKIIIETNSSIRRKNIEKIKEIIQDLLIIKEDFGNIFP